MERPLVLRQATSADAHRVWEWANDPATREASFGTAPIAWELHVAWFDAWLADPGKICWLAELAGEPVAQLRYALDDREATVSLCVAPEARGRGLGMRVVVAGSERLFATTDVDVIHAQIKGDNEVSRRLFLRAGYVERPPVEVGGQRALHLTHTRPARS